MVDTRDKNVVARWIGLSGAASVAFVAALATAPAVAHADTVEAEPEAVVQAVEPQQETAITTSDPAAQETIAASVAETTPAAEEAVPASEAAAPTVDDAAMVTAAPAEEETGSDDASGAPATAAEATDGEIALMADTDSATVGGFNVVGDASNYSYDNGVLTVRGNVEISTNGETADRIVVAENATVRLAGVNIKATAAKAAIQIASNVKATLTLVANTVNTVVGGADHAGIEVSWVDEDTYADLTINGTGELKATGGSDSAGIGGSVGEKAVYGNITIDEGNIEANGNGGGAGIGTMKGRLRHIHASESCAMVAPFSSDMRASRSSSPRAAAKPSQGYTRSTIFQPSTM